MDVYEHKGYTFHRTECHECKKAVTATVNAMSVAALLMIIYIEDVGQEYR